METRSASCFPTDEHPVDHRSQSRPVHTRRNADLAARTFGGARPRPRDRFACGRNPRRTTGTGHHLHHPPPRRPRPGRTGSAAGNRRTNHCPTGSSRRSSRCRGRRRRGVRARLRIARSHRHSRSHSGTCLLPDLRRRPLHRRHHPWPWDNRDFSSRRRHGRLSAVAPPVAGASTDADLSRPWTHAG